MGKLKDKYADELVKKMEEWKTASWVDDIDKSTMIRVIDVCKNIVKSWASEK